VKVNKYIIVLLLLSAAIVSVSTYYALNNSTHTKGLADKALSTEHQIARIEHIYVIVSDADEGVKNYALTGKDKYIIPTDTSLAKLHRTLKALKSDIIDDTDFMEDVSILEKLATKEINSADKIIRVRNFSFDSASKLIQSSEGIELMDSIKAVTSNIYKRERNERNAFTEQDEIANKRTNSTIMLGEIAGFLITLFVLLFLNNDLRKRAKTEQQLRVSELRHRTISQNMGSIIYTCDYYGKITFVTSNITILTGYTPVELMGRHFTFIIAPEFSDEQKKLFYEQFKAKIEKKTYVFDIITKYGERKKVEQDVVIFSAEGTLMGFQCMLREIETVR
jgi:PAS domain S-box-containing protein